MRNCILLLVSIALMLLSFLGFGVLTGLVIAGVTDAARPLSWAVFGAFVGCGITSASIHEDEWA